MGDFRRLIFLLFIVNGVGYLFFTNQLYNDSGWYVWVKYFLLLIWIFLYFFFSVSRNKLTVNLNVVALFFFVAFLFSFPLLFGADKLRVAQYIMPVLSLFLFPSWRLSMSRGSFSIILWLTIFGALYEYFWLGGFERFSPNGYRGISIFVNPNNLGISIVILSAAAILSGFGHRRFLLLATLSIVIYSGSKTALVMWFVLLVGVESKKFAISGGFLLVVSIVPFILSFESYKMFERYSFKSLIFRMSYASDFFSKVGNWLFPSADHANYYVDNAYIQLWIDLGLYSSILIFISMLILVVLAKGYRLIFLLFFIAALTTNILYTAPISYLFWMTLGDYIRSLTVIRGFSRVAVDDKTYV